MDREEVSQRFRQAEDGQESKARRSDEEAAQHLLVGTHLDQARKQEEVPVWIGGLGEGFNWR